MNNSIDNRIRKRTFTVLLCALVATVIGAGLFCAETVLRKIGYGPWQPELYRGTVERYNKYPKKDYDRQGNQRIEIVKTTLTDGYTWHATLNGKGLRITRPFESYKSSASKKKIWIFGCSYTYGFALRDDQTYPWLLQKELPQYEIVNWGVNGFGTLHSFLQLREALKSEQKPSVIVFTYGSLHDERNTLFRPMRKVFSAHVGKTCFIRPYARLDSAGALQIHTGEKLCYNEIPFIRSSSLVHTLERFYNAVDRFFHAEHSVLVSREIIRRTMEICRQKNICLVIAGISADSATRNMLAYFHKLGANVVDISVDLSISENRHAHDPHPSAKANERFADKLHSFLVNNVLHVTCDN